MGTVGSPLILIADDTAEVRHLFKLKLGKPINPTSPTHDDLPTNYTIIEASNGREALQLFEECAPDLVLLDIMMPELDGIEVCHRLRQLPTGKAVPILMITAFDATDIIQRAFAAGATDFITKPVNWSILFHRVSRLLATHQAQLQLQAQQEFTTALISSLSVATVVLNTQHQVVYWNKAIEELTGITASQMLGTINHLWSAFYTEPRPTLADIIIDGNYTDLVKLYPYYQKSKLNPDAVYGESWFDAVGGKRRYLAFESTPIYDTQGILLAAATILQDRTQQRLVEEKLAESEANFRAVLEGSLDAFLLLKPVVSVKPSKEVEIVKIDKEKEEATETTTIDDFIFTEVNQVGETLLRRNRADLLGQSLTAMYPTTATNGVFETIRQATTTGKNAEIEIAITQPEVRAKWLRIQVVPLGVQSGGVAAICHDITQHKQKEAELSQQAYYDSLTGLPNRVLFGERVEQVLRTVKMREEQGSISKSFAICFLDLNHFKQVNDTYGHNVGDLLLQAVATRLKSSLRSEDTVARMGGDEFCILLPEVENRQVVEAVVARLKEELAPVFSLKVAVESENATGGGDRVVGELHELNMSASIGISFYPEDGRDIATLLAHSDKKMYSAKRNRTE